VRVTRLAGDFFCFFFCFLLLVAIDLSPSIYPKARIRHRGPIVKQIC
jgi:hypothetical protein